MALNKLKFNSLNVTPSASKAIKFNSSANGFETGDAGGAMKFIKKLTASSDSALSFVNGSSDVVLDNTYKEYLFIFNNIHTSANAYIQVNFRDGSTDYDASKTTTMFYIKHKEDDGLDNVAMLAGNSLGNSTGIQRLTAGECDTGNDSGYCGFLHLFNPSSTTFVKHFISSSQYVNNSPGSENQYVAGYCNVTAAIDAVQFSTSSGNMDTGTITLYGIN